MAIQGTQVPMYTNTHCFCIFLIFQFLFYLFLYEKKTKIEKKKEKKNKLNKAMHKTRLTQNNKAKHTNNAKQKQEGERDKMTESLRALFLPHLGRTFPFSKLLI